MTKTGIPDDPTAAGRTRGHAWIPSTLGHGETMCLHCFITNREAAVLGIVDAPCDKAPRTEGVAPDTTGEMTFGYTNYRGEIGRRRVRPVSIRFGASEWHPGLQWLLVAYDLDKGERREFAMRDMFDVSPPSLSHAVSEGAWRDIVSAPKNPEWTADILPDGNSEGAAIAYADNDGTPLLVLYWEEDDDKNAKFVKWAPLPRALPAQSGCGYDNEEALTTVAAMKSTVAALQARVAELEEALRHIAKGTSPHADDVVASRALSLAPKIVSADDGVV